MIKLNEVNGKRGWRCEWCGKETHQVHWTRASNHVLKIQNGSIAICVGTIPSNYLHWYRKLRDGFAKRVEVLKCSTNETEHHVNFLQEMTVAVVLSGKRRHASHDSNGNVELIKNPSVISFVSIGPQGKRFPSPCGQSLSIASGSSNQSLISASIEKTKM